MKNKILKNSKYVLFFFLFLLSYLFLPLIAADESWSYGFCYNVATGLVPYRDFNMIVPPLFPFLFSVGLFFYKGILMFHMEQALLLVGICYFLERLVGKKYIFLVLFLMVMSPMVYNLPTYNTLSFFFVLLLIFLEERNSSDFLIGIILGFSLLTKQSIGLFILFVGLYLGVGDAKRFSLRCAGVILPLLLCGCYLLFAGNLKGFIDQCILGMIDFSGNGQVFLFRPLFCILFFLFFLFWWRRGHYDKKWLYAISFYSISIPLFDFSHFLLGAFSLAVIFVSSFSFEPTSRVRTSLFLLLILIPCLTSYQSFQKGYFPTDFSNHEYRYLNQETYQNLTALRTYHQEHPNQKIVILSTCAYLFKLTNEIPIDKLDLVNKGNWGRGGTSKIISEIKKLRGTNTLFLINPQESSTNQIDKEVLSYVMKKGKKVDQVLYFEVYQLN